MTCATTNPDDFDNTQPDILPPLAAWHPSPSADDQPLSVVLAADSAIIGDGLAALLAGRDEVTVAGRVFDSDQLSFIIEQTSPDVLILWIRAQLSSSMQTVEAARRLRADNPLLGVVIIADRSNGFALELLRDGASRIAFLIDDGNLGFDGLLGAINEVRAGQTVLDPSVVDSLIRRRDVVPIDGLTMREIDVLEYLAQGRSNRGIAEELHLSIKSIEKNITTIFRKLGLNDQPLVDRRVTASVTYNRVQLGRPDQSAPQDG